MKILVILMAVLCLALFGCASDDGGSDGAVEASVAADAESVDQAGEGTSEAGPAEDVGAEDAPTPEDAVAEAAVDAGAGG